MNSRWSIGIANGVVLEMSALLVYYVACFAASLLSLPLIMRFPAGALTNYILARTLGTVFLALICFHVARWAETSLHSALLPSVALTAVTLLLPQWRRSVGRMLAHRRSRSILLQTEAAYVAAYLLFALLFGFHYGNSALGERPLDLGLTNWLMAAPAFPPENFWASGIQLSYYYFGFLKVAMLGLASRLSGEHAYFAGMCQTWSAALLSTWVAARMLGARGGLTYIVPAAAVLMSSAAPLYQWHAADAPPWDQSAFLTYVRVIPGTINEVPSIALWASELHAHILALPLLVLVIAMFTKVLRRPSATGGALFSCAAAALLMTDGWQVPVAAIACGALSCTYVVSKMVRLRVAGITLLALSALTLLLAAPLLVGFRGHEIRFKRVAESTTNILHLVVLFGPVCGLLILLLLRSQVSGRIRNQVFRVSAPLAFTGLFVIFSTEYVYLDTGFPPPAERQNTVMRLHWAAYLCLCMSAGPLLSSRSGLTTARMHRTETAAWLWLTFFVVLGMISPGLRIAKLVRHGGVWKSDIRRAMESTQPGTIRAAEFFRRTPSDTVLLESSGAPYQGFALISALSGRRAVLGELDKVLSHGISVAELQRRRADILEVYTDGPRASQVLKEYGIDYIVAGPAELRAYPGTAMGTLLTKYRTAFRSGEILVLRAE